MKKYVESVHEGKIFKCAICPSSFTVKWTLKTHIESIHEEKTSKCEVFPIQDTENHVENTHELACTR